MKTKIIFLITIFLLSFIKNSAYTQDIEEESEVKVQIALLLDTSSSMDGLIDQAKSQLWKIVNELARSQYFKEIPKLEIALFEYGNDNLSKSDGYIRMVSELTDDLDKISEDLFSLSTNGGDEYCGEVIENALEKLNWSKSDKDLKIIFIAGNEDFDQGKINYSKVCKDAKEDGVIINTIFCGNYDQGISIHWKDGAEIAEGKYMNIDQNRKVVVIETPYDDQIMELNSELNETYIAYSTEGEEKKLRQKKQDSFARSSSKGSAVERTVSKSSVVYSNSEWDLVDAFEEDEAIVEDLKEEELPEELQGKTTEEITEYINEKQLKRTEIQNQIKELNSQRLEYIEQQSSNDDDVNSLDEAMLEIIREQAENKGFTFDNE